MIDVRKLNHWRRHDLEAIIFPNGRPDGCIAGDIVLGPAHSARSIRFSIEQSAQRSTVSLSAENHTRCTDVDVSRFMKFSGMKITGETAPKLYSWMRHFDVVAR